MNESLGLHKKPYNVPMKHLLNFIALQVAYSTVRSCTPLALRNEDKVCTSHKMMESF